MKPLVNPTPMPLRKVATCPMSNLREYWLCKDGLVRSYAPLLESNCGPLVIFVQMAKEGRIKARLTSDMM